MNTVTPSIHRPPTVLPPRGLLLNLLAQAPLVATNWPLQPTLFEILAGTVLIASGAILNIWAERLFRWSATGVCPFSPASVLVQSGPFTLSRNPMYLGLVAISTGATLITGVLPNMWISVAYAIWLHYAFILPEEDFLRNQFGAAYDDYSKRIPRWMLFK
jgi:protein-S-isoprenylcysteine O-methyltransferase Ste14